jgi:hypothetical protein
MPPDPLPPAATASILNPDAQHRRRASPTWWIAGIGFLLGLVAMFYALPAVQRWRSFPAPEAAPVLAQQAPAAAPASQPLSVDAMTARLLLLDAQLRAVEARMSVADAGARAAAGNATRAEALVIALAARRELNRGLPLGALEGQLQARFGASHPREVGAVLAAARAPVTLEDLRFSLDAIAPSLMTGTASEGIATAMWRELKSMIVLRREVTPSPRPRDRMTRARRLLDAGQVEAALAEIARMPGVASATSWTDAARRYIGARQALNALEQAALAPVPAPVPINPVGALPGG